MFINTIVIAAAGRGTRFGELTTTQPKHLLPVCGKPFFSYVLQMVQQATFERVIVVIDYQADLMEQFLSEQLLSLEIVRQSQVVGDRYGSASVIEAAASRLQPDEPFVLLNGDSLFPPQVLQTLRFDDGFNHVLVAPHEHPEHYGVIELNDEGGLARIIEKPQQPPTNLINLGLYVFQPEIVDRCKAVSVSPRGEYEVTDALNALATEGKVKCDQWSGDWVDYGKPEDLAQVETFIKNHYA